MSDAPAADPDTTPQRSFNPLEAIVGLGGIQALTMLAGLARSKILALLLGPAVLGIVGVIDQVVSFLTHAGSLSTPFAATKFLSRRIREEARQFRRLFSGLFFVMLAGSLVATVVVAVVAAYRPQLLSSDLEGYRTPLLLALLTVPGLTAVAFQRSVLAVLSRHRDAALASFVSSVALVGTSWVGIELAGVVGLYAGNLLVHVPMAVGIYLYLREKSTLALVPEFDEIRSALGREEDLRWYLTIFHLTTLVTPLAYLTARVSVLNHHGAEAAGLYYAAYGIAVSVRVILTQGNTLYLTPIMNRPTPVTDRIESAGEYLRVLSALVLVGGLGLMLFPELWIWLLYSAEFTDASAFLGAFVVGEMLLLFAGVYLNLLIGLDDLSGHISMSVAGHTAILVLALVLTPPFGPVGVAYAFIIGNGGMLVGCMMRLWTQHPEADLFRPVPPMATSVGLLVLTAFALGSAPGLGVLWRLGGWVCGGGVALFLLTPNERSWILSPWRWADVAKHEPDSPGERRPPGDRDEETP